MMWRQIICAILVACVAGCHTPAPVCRTTPPSILPPPPALPAAKPEVVPFDLALLPAARVQLPEPGERAYRGLTPELCQTLAARNTSPANTLDDENRVPVSGGGCETEAEQLRRTVRQFTALEFRNQSASGALDRYYQLADAELRAELARESLPILDDLFEKAAAAKKANVRHPLDPMDVDRQRGSLVLQIEEADASITSLNIDIRRRLGLPVMSDTERIWPTTEFALDEALPDEEEAAQAAIADRPELRALRALHQGLNVNTLPVARDMLRGNTPLVATAAASSGLGPVTQCLVAWNLKKAGPDPCAAAEVEVRKKQLADLIAIRERSVADEARVSVITLNSHRLRVALARDRLAERRADVAEAQKKLDAMIIGSDLVLANAQLDLLKARSEVVAEVMAWHQARVRLRAALGWLAWETLPNSR